MLNDKLGYFYAHSLIRLPSRKNILPSGESLSCKQREVQPFLCLRASGSGDAYKIVRNATDNFHEARPALNTFQG